MVKIVKLDNDIGLSNPYKNSPWTCSKNTCDHMCFKFGKDRFKFDEDKFLKARFKFNKDKFRFDGDKIKQSLKGQ